MTDFQEANRCLVAKKYTQAIELFLHHAKDCPTEAAQAYAGAAECYLRSNILEQQMPVVPGVALVSMANHQAAEKYFRLALQVDPTNAKALWGLSKILPESADERLDLLARSVAVLPGTLNLVALGDYYRSQSKDYDLAYQLYKRAQAHAPRDKTAYLCLSDICRRLGRSEEAKEWTRRWQEAKKQKRRVDGKE